MITSAKVEANRQNSQRSTGPRTSEGRARSSANSLKHGLLAQRLLLADEDAAELEKLSNGLRKQLAPEGELEHLLVNRVVGAAWRLRRAERIEVELLQYHQPVDDDHHHLHHRLALALVRDAHHGDVFSKLTRYESALQRSLLRCLHELERVQAIRAGRSVPLPLAVDLDLVVEVDGGQEQGEAVQP